jgi:DNA-binding MarR family transcriptional regulator
MTSWLSEPQQRVWRSWLDVERKLAERLHRQLMADSGMSLREYEVLVWLSEAPGRRLRMSELADALVFARSRLTHTVRRMEERGLVRRAPCEDDGRGVLCELTDAGFDVLAAAAPGHVAEVRALLIDPLDPAALEALGAALDRIRATLRER